MTKRKELVCQRGKRLSKRVKAELLHVNRSSLYVKRQAESSEVKTIKKHIQKIYEKHPFMGYRKVTIMLKRLSYKINRKRVYRYMKELGLQAIAPKRNLSKRNQQEKVYPYLLKEQPPRRPNDCWCTDITYIRMPKGYVYLNAFVDVISRRIMGWHCSPFLDTSSVLEAFRNALKSGHKPKMINSDQGTQYTSKAWAEALKTQGIAISMDGRGRCLDNIPIERFWRSLKYEEVFLQTYDTVAEARQSIDKYIRWFNAERPHQSLGYATPDQVFTECNDQRNAEKMPQDEITSLPHTAYNLTFFERPDSQNKQNHKMQKLSHLVAV